MQRQATMKIAKRVYVISDLHLGGDYPVAPEDEDEDASHLIDSPADAGSALPPGTAPADDADLDPTVTNVGDRGFRICTHHWPSRPPPCGDS